MLRIKNLRNKYQKRLIRPLYAQTQATPYAASLDSTLRDVNGDFSFTVGSFKYKNGLVPGTVVVQKGEKIIVADGSNPGGAGQPPYAFGLLANFVGGDLDELGDENFVGVWRGPDAVFEILAPAFDTTNLLTAWNASTAGAPAALYAGTDGRLAALASPGNRQVVAYLIDKPTDTRIVVDLKV